MKFGFKHALIIILSAGVFACSGGGSGGGTTPTETVNTAPVANAGAAQTVDTGTVVTLNAGASTDANGDVLTYLWSVTGQPSGSAVTLSSDVASAPTFTPAIDGTYTFRLFVNDGSTNSLGDSVEITATSPNVAPVANAGADQPNVTTGETVTLNGTATDANSDALTYAWTLTAPTASSATLSDSTISSPTFITDVEGTYTAQLIVSDSALSSAADVVEIVAVTAVVNSAPIAIVGPNQNVTTGTVVTLDGTGSSDPDGDGVTYLWTLTAKPTSSTAVLENETTASPNFTTDLDGTYTASLTINDGQVNSPAVIVDIIASSGNSAPTANAGDDQRVLVNTTVSLDGTQSKDVDIGDLTYQWTLLSGPAGNNATITNNTNATGASFIPNVVGEYIVQLIVNDAVVDSAPDTVAIDVVTDGAPIANAGIRQVVKTGVEVRLDGSASVDVDGDGLSYAWDFVSIPTGSNAQLSAQLVNPAFISDVEGSYIISLVVTDTTNGSSIADTVEIIVSDTDITLSKETGLFTGTFNDIEFPFVKDIELDIELEGSPIPTSIPIQTFRLSAQGGDLTIVNIRFDNDTNDAIPSFVGLSEGLVIKDGETVEFGLNIRVDIGEEVRLSYSFDIQETKQTFSSRYTLEISVK